MSSEPGEVQAPKLGVHEIDARPSSGSNLSATMQDLCSVNCSVTIYGGHRDKYRKNKCSRRHRTARSRPRPPRSRPECHYCLATRSRHRSSSLLKNRPIIDLLGLDGSHRPLTVDHPICSVFLSAMVHQRLGTEQSYSPVCPELRGLAKHLLPFFGMLA